MSKQSEAKAAQGYVNKPVHNTCSNCDQFSSDFSIKRGYFGGVYKKEVLMRCSMGDFKVGKTSVCNQWRAK